MIFVIFKINLRWWETFIKNFNFSMSDIDLKRIGSRINNIARTLFQQFLALFEKWEIFLLSECLGAAISFCSKQGFVVFRELNVSTRFVDRIDKETLRIFFYDFSVYLFHNWVFVQVKKQVKVKRVSYPQSNLRLLTIKPNYNTWT